MLQVLNMPSLSPTMSQGNILEWKKKVSEEGRRRHPMDEDPIGDYICMHAAMCMGESQDTVECVSIIDNVATTNLTSRFLAPTHHASL